MRKIHITESQLEELRKKLTEAYNVDITQDLEQGKTPQQIVANKKAENPNLNNDANSGEVSFTFNPNGIDEGTCFTKGSIKKAKIKNLQENSTMYIKKNLK